VCSSVGPPLLRSTARLTQADVHTRLAITYQQVQKYENGRDRVGVSTLHRRRSQLGCHYPNFFTGLGSGMLAAAPDFARRQRIASRLSLAVLAIKSQDRQ
jgi:hypothetical protein